MSPFFQPGRPPPTAGESHSATLRGCRAQVQGGVLSPLLYAIQPAIHPCHYAPSKFERPNVHPPVSIAQRAAIKLISPAEVSAGFASAYGFIAAGESGAVKGKPPLAVALPPLTAPLPSLTGYG